MQVTETLSEGLKRQYKVSIPAGDLAKKLDTELAALKTRVNINGFRPGKVPVQHLRRVYGRSVMADVIQTTLNDANKKIIEDNGIKLAGEPKIELPEAKETMEAVMAATGDLEYTVALEILPKITINDHSDIVLERQVAGIADADIEATIQRMADSNRPFAAKKEGAKAAKGDRVTIDFLGKIDGAAFDGGKGEDMPLVIGSGGFIPGFEDQLTGVKAGEARVLNVSFPADYQAASLAGKAAVFEVTCKAVEAPGDIKIDDDLAKQFGMESLDKLKEAIKSSMGKDLEQVSRRKLKRALLDKLDGKYAFDVPPSLLEQEFAGIWKQVQDDLKQANRTFADEETTEDEARAEYQKIAARRVRLGLVLAEIGEQAKLQITDDEVTQALVERVRQFPGQEKMVWDFYRKNPQALAEVRAPLFEEKVVDLVLAQAKVTDKTVSKEDLLKEDDDEITPLKKKKAAKKPKKAEEKRAE